MKKGTILKTKVVKIGGLSTKVDQVYLGGQKIVYRFGDKELTGKQFWALRPKFLAA